MPGWTVDSSSVTVDASSLTDAFTVDASTPVWTVDSSSASVDSSTLTVDGGTGAAPPTDTSWRADSATVLADSDSFTADGSSASLPSSGWTADSATVTADSAVFTADGAMVYVPPAPGTVFNFYGGQFAQDAYTFGQLNLTQSPQYIAPARQVSSNSLLWSTACRLAGRPPIEFYPVYQFGGGLIQRVFTQRV